MDDRFYFYIEFLLLFEYKKVIFKFGERERERDISVYIFLKSF